MMDTCAAEYIFLISGDFGAVNDEMSSFLFLLLSQAVGRAAHAALFDVSFIHAVALRVLWTADRGGPSLWQWPERPDISAVLHSLGA